TSRMNQEQIIFTLDDLSDIEQMVGGTDGTTLSYTARGTIEGGTLTKSQTLTVAGVKEDYALLSKLQMAEGTFLNTGQDFLCEKVCVLGNKAAEEIFGSGSAVTGETIYISDRMYTVIGVLETAATVSAGISPDTSIFIPYETGIKYLTGENISPKITVLAHDVDTLESVITGIKSVLMGKYPNAEFVFEDSGSKMKAAQSSNRTLTILLSAMAVIVFLVGGIGIMNVLFVSVKERTNEIGILKAIGTSKTDILSEFLAESALISLIGGMIGILVSLGLVPILEYYQVRVEISSAACFAALGFALLTGIIFGIYPAWKAAKLEPVEALQAD
ncbi:MAG: ABC transporter permease, partial [Lachnospiraceae bacterium]|nr:ABC transporter permease [Lachnospiraceae bacterium]